MGSLADSTPAMLLKDAMVTKANAIAAGTFTGWTFKFGNLPDSPDKCIALIDQGGPSGMPNLLVDNPGVQILVRGAVGGTSYLDGWLIARAVRDIILGITNHPPGFAELDGITERGTNPVPLGYDDKSRHIWSSNYQLLVEPVANALTNRMAL